MTRKKTGTGRNNELDEQRPFFVAASKDRFCLLSLNVSHVFSLSNLKLELNFHPSIPVCIQETSVPDPKIVVCRLSGDDC